MNHHAITDLHTHGGNKETDEMKNDLYLMKILTTESPYYQIVRGNFRYLDAVMAKADELKMNATVQKIVIKKRMVNRSTNIYKWDRGFEVIYLGQ